MDDESTTPLDQAETEQQLLAQLAARRRLAFSVLDRLARRAPMVPGGVLERLSIRAAALPSGAARYVGPIARRLASFSSPAHVLLRSRSATRPQMSWGRGELYWWRRRAPVQAKLRRDRSRAGRAEVVPARPALRRDDQPSTPV